MRDEREIKQLEYQTILKGKLSMGDDRIGQCFCGRYFTAKIWNTSVVNRKCIEYTLCRKCRRGESK